MVDIWRYIPQKYMEAIEDCEVRRPEDGTIYWIYLKEGWVAYDGGDDCGTILENTIKDLKKAIKTIKRKGEKDASK